MKLYTTEFHKKRFETFLALHVILFGEFVQLGFRGKITIPDRQGHRSSRSARSDGAQHTVDHP